MAADAGFLVLILAAGVMISATYFDIRYRILPDILSILLIILATARWLVADELHTMVWAVICALAVFAVAAFAFARGWLGGGDVKFLGATSFVVGSGAVPTLLLIMSLAGGVLSLMVLAWHYGSRAFGKKPVIAPGLGIASDESMAIAAPPTVPYGVAIACAGLYVLFMQYRLGIK